MLVVTPRVLAIGAAAAMALSLGCRDSTGASAHGGGVGAVHGSVTSAKTSLGVPGLVVAIVHEGRVHGVSATDSDGAFRFASVPAGASEVRVTGFELAGLTERLTTLEPSKFDIHLDDGQSLDLFFAAVGLVPPRVVGLVRCGGVPVQGAQVRLVGGATDTVVVSNAQGKYAVTDLDPGHYAVVVVDAPCTVGPRFGTAHVLAGQLATVDFDG